MEQRENTTDFANKTLEELRNDVKCAILELTDEERKALLMWMKEEFTDVDKMNAKRPVEDVIDELEGIVIELSPDSVDIGSDCILEVTSSDADYLTGEVIFESL